MVLFRWLPLLMSVCLIGTLGCSADESEARAPLPGDDKVLARVNETTVTAYDVERAIERTFGPEGARALDAAARRKVLESLVTSRAIALAREKELTAEDRARLEKHVAAEKEERLVKDYLSKHSPPKPVTSDMVRRYYESHRERFSGEKLRRYELVLSERELNGKERDDLLTALGQPAKEADWSAYAQRLKSKGLPITYSQGVGNEAALHPILRDALGKLEVGQASSLLFIQNRAYAVRVLEVQQPSVRPLDQVSEEIRDILTPVQVKEALRTAGAKARAKVKVEYSGS